MNWRLIRDLIGGFIICTFLTWMFLTWVDHLPPSQAELRGEIKMGPVH